MPDFMIAIGQLLDGSPPQAWALWALSNIPGFPPIIQSVHILGIAVVMGSIVMLDLRILGLAVPSQQIPEMARRVMPWLWCALASNLFSGSFFVFARPLRYFNNPIFGWKASFLLSAILVTVLIHWWSRQQDFVNANGVAALKVKATALLSLGLWIMVAMAGRWIAYVEYIYFPA